jgi:CRP-like cAMP-binding protein
MYVVLDGEMVASVATDEGRRELAVMGRGDSVGEVALFHGVRTADVDTRNDVRAVRLSRHDLVRLRRRYPRIGAKIFWNLSEILASRVANTTKKMR